MESKISEPTCADIIDEHLKERLEEFIPDVTQWSVLKCARHLKTLGCHVRTADVEELRAEVLQVIFKHAAETLAGSDLIFTHRLTLSWGGPADYLELDWNPRCREWWGGRYILEDWFQGAQRRLSAEQAEKFAQVFRIKPGFK